MEAWLTPDTSWIVLSVVYVVTGVVGSAKHGIDATTNWLLITTILLLVLILVLGVHFVWAALAGMILLVLWWLV